jgi:hypothetical protein
MEQIENVTNVSIEMVIRAMIEDMERALADFAFSFDKTGTEDCPSTKRNNDEPIDVEKEVRNLVLKVFPNVDKTKLPGLVRDSIREAFGTFDESARAKMVPTGE